MRDTGSMPSAVDVSVVVATRNRASLLGDCLRSLSAQRSDVGLEIVVVDNGSEDATPQVVQEWSRLDKRIRSVEQPAIGLSRAKNAGIRSAKGRLLLFTDDDVVVSDRWIEAHVDFFRRTRGLVVAGGPVLPIAHDLGSWPPWVTDAATAELVRLYYGEEEHLLEGFERPWGANMAARRELFDEVGLFNDFVGRIADERGTFEDVEFVDRVRAAGGQAWYCASARVYHRVPAAGVELRTIVSVAFVRGGDDFLRRGRASYFEPALPVPTRRVAAAIALPWMVAGAVLSAAAFRLTAHRAASELARKSAWGTGWCMLASTGLGSALPLRAVRRLTVLFHDFAVRLIPD